MTEEIKNGEIIIFKAQDGPELKITLERETVWLTQIQISDLFGTGRAAISKHIKNIYNSSELSQDRTVSKMETVQMEGGRAIKRQVEYYNLDMVLSIGYRVNSKRATQFRIWATQRLKDYLLKGYAVNEKRLKEEHDLKLKELEQTTHLFYNVLESRRAEGYEKDLLQIITDYAHTWAVLNKFDKDELLLEGLTKKTSTVLEYEQAINYIEKFKKRLALKKEAGSLFGQEVGGKFKSVLGSIYQTFGGKELYGSVEEKAAHLLYFAIKDHPFADGNKRIGSLMFLLFLVENGSLMSRRGERKINDNALAALALLIAESRPQQKDIMVKLVVNLINKR